MFKTIIENLSAIKEKKPLVHHITNYVTVNDCANITLAIGASPVMADDEQEVTDMVSYAAALVLNIGTLNSRTVNAMLKAGQKAKNMGIPVIFDPVGVGATNFRSETAKMILRELSPTVIRGNMSEIKILAGQNVVIKGVDSVADSTDGVRIARELSEKLRCIVAITGPTDIVCSPDRLCFIDNGHPMLTDVTGTGCMTTSLIGAYCGAGKDYFISTAAGIMTMGLAGELAYRSLLPADGVGTFKQRLFDSVYCLTPEMINEGGKIKYEQV